MAVQNIGNNILGGLAADTKPTTYAVNTIFYEYDTGALYVWDGGAWVQKTPGFGTANTFNKVAQATTAELLAEWKVADDAASYVKLANNTTTDAHFAATIISRNATASSYNAMYLVGEVTDALDTGSTPVYRLSSRTTTLNPITTRPLFDFQNNGISVFTIKPTTIDLTIGNTDGAAEILETWKIADGGSSRIEFRNATATDDEFVPQLRAFNESANTTNPGMFFDSFIQSGQDSGTVSAHIFRALKSDSTALATRPLYEFRNGPSTSIFKLGQTTIDTPLTLAITKTSSAGVAETIQTWTISDSSSTGIVRLKNVTATDTVFAPWLEFTQSASSGQTALLLTGIGSNTDSGTTPLIAFDVFKLDGSAFVTRPLYEFRNDGTQVFRIFPGTVDISLPVVINRTAGSSDFEVLQEWKVTDDTTGSKFEIINGTSTNGLFVPLVRSWFRGASTAHPGLYLFSHIATGQDSGTTPVMVLDARKDDATAVATRPLFRFRNAGATLLDINIAKLVLKDAYDIEVGTTTGTKIGTGTTQKIGFYNATPIAQGASIADPTGGATQDAEARTAIIALISRLEALGLIATV